MKPESSTAISVFLTVFLITSLSMNVSLISSEKNRKEEVISLREDVNNLTWIGSELYRIRAELRLHSDVVTKLIPKILEHESKFNPAAVGDNGRSHGAGQIQFKTALGIMRERKLTVEDLYDPYVNPFLASEYLEYLYQKHKNIQYALSAYNGGLKIKDGIVTMTNVSSYVMPILGKVKSK